jgi:hypothetical protein
MKEQATRSSAGGSSTAYYRLLRPGMPLAITHQSPRFGLGLPKATVTGWLKPEAQQATT